MTTTAASLDTAGAVLELARARRRAAEEAERDVLVAAVRWAAWHATDSPVDAAWHTAPGCEEDVAIAGDGAPYVAEFAVADLAAALGLSTDAGRRYLGQAIELRHRLPSTWGRVVAGDVLAWKARSIADRTMPLSEEAARWVDRHVAPFAHSVGPVQLDRVVDEAMTRFMPDEAETKRRAAAEQRHFDIWLDRAGTDGVVPVDGTLDVRDALALEAAVAATAAELAALGSGESLDVRRSRAIGEVARRDLTLVDDRGLAASTISGGGTPRPARREPVVLYVHLSDTALTGRSAVGRCANTDSPITVEQVRAWCATAGRVTVRPVLDLAAHSPVDAYEIPDRHREVVRLRDRHCVFPYCRRQGGGCDCDHVRPYDPDGPPHQTCPCNLAPLCRYHHRLKTHGGWTYTSIEPGTYLWSSPQGYTFAVTPLGTDALDP